MVQQQLYATMPKYVIRMAGETAKPGWIANVNPFVVVCCVSFITKWMAKRTAITSMNIGMFLIPVSALLMACGNLLGNDVISGMSNITLMMILGIVVQALAECFISPRYLEYFSFFFNLLFYILVELTVLLLFFVRYRGDLWHVV